jgi:hypothetical protein
MPATKNATAPTPSKVPASRTLRSAAPSVARFACAKQAAASRRKVTGECEVVEVVHWRAARVVRAAGAGTPSGSPSPFRRSRPPSLSRGERAECGSDGFDDTVGVGEHVVVPETQDAVAFCVDEGGAFGVVRLGKL